MARKRTSLKDKNVIKRTKALDELIGTSTSANTKDEDTMSEKDQENLTSAEDSTESPDSLNSSDDLSALENQATLAEGNFQTETENEMTAEDSDFDLDAFLGEQAEVAEGATIPELFPEEEPDFPPALESPPPDAFSDDLPVGEAGLGDTVDEFGFPAAMDPSLEDSLLEDFPAAATPDPTSMSTAETHDLEIDPFAFPEAINTLPENEADLDIPETTPSGEADLDGSEALPIDEAAFETPAGTLEPDNGFGTPDPFESTGPSPVDDPYPRPVQPPASDDFSGSTDDLSSSDPLPSPPAVSVAVSRTTPLTLGDDAPRDIFDFMGVSDEPETIQYQIPDDIEELTPEERKRRMLLLKDEYVKEQFEKIYKAIDQEYEHLLDNNTSSNKSITDWTHNLLAETRYILMNYQIEHLAKAEWNIQQVKARLDRAEESEKWRRKWAWRIITWGMLWFVVFLTLIFYVQPITLYLPQPDGPAAQYLDVEVLLRTIFFGGIGGVTAVFYSLLKYVSRRDYDKEYNLSYFTKPFMGMVVGTLIYLLIFVAATVLGLNPAGLGAATESTLAIEILTYFVALAAGFKENIALALLSRVMKVIFREDQEESSETLPESRPPTSPFNPTAGSTR